MVPITKIRKSDKGSTCGAKEVLIEGQEWDKELNFTLVEFDGMIIYPNDSIKHGRVILFLISSYYYRV